MFQNMLITSLTPLCNTDEINGWENRPFATIWPEKLQQKTKGNEVSKTIKKKSKRVRTAYTTEQLRMLENTYSRFKYIDAQYRKELAHRMKIGEKSVKIWFQNRRMKEKRDSDSCDSSNESFRTPSPVNAQQSVETSAQKVGVLQPESYGTYPTNNQTVNAIPQGRYVQSVVSSTQPTNEVEDIAQVMDIIKSEAESTYSAHDQNVETAEARKFVEVESSTCAPNNFGSIHSESDESQYILPPCYYNNYFQNNAPNTSAQSTFCYDTNAYPTQYYPSGGEYYTNAYTQYNNESNWHSNLYNMGYY